uniref:Uncharacterized protein n=1 Tax=Knipowitschia caucasica TaxID=637954 RepID=A0AAV2JDG7_KNICA
MGIQLDAGLKFPLFLLHRSVSQTSPGSFHFSQIVESATVALHTDKQHHHGPEEAVAQFLFPRNLSVGWRRLILFHARGINLHQKGVSL